MYARTICILNEKLYHYFINEESTVLKKNANYHLDLLKVNQLKWKNINRQDLLINFPKLWNMILLRHFILAGMKMLFLRFDVPSYELFYC